MDETPVDANTPQEVPAAKQSSPAEIRGAIDGFRYPGQVSGWAVKRRDGKFLTDIRVEARRGAIVIAEAIPVGPRPDATQDETTPAAFLIDLKDVAVMEELLDGRVEILGVDAEGRSNALHFHLPARQKAVGDMLAALETRIALIDRLNRLSKVSLNTAQEQASLGPLRGAIDRIDHTVISGWAVDTANPDRPVALEILDNDEIIASIPADQYRKDLAAAGFGTGHHGFVFRRLQGSSRLLNHAIQIRRKADKLQIPGAQALLAKEPARFDRDIQRLFARLLANEAKSDAHAENLNQKIEFLLGQTEKLIDARVKLATSGEIGNPAAIRQRWIEALANYIHDGGSTVESRTTRLHALFIDYALPVPNHDAGSNAAIGQMLSLMRLGYAVSCVGTNTYNAISGDSYFLQKMGIQTYSPPEYGSVDDVFLFSNLKFDVIYFHRVSTAASYLAMAREYFPEARLIYSVIDLHFLRSERQAVIEQKPTIDAGLEQDELALARMADAVITYSSYEAAILAAEIPAKNVHIIPWPIQASPRYVPVSDRRGIAFIGGYLHAPNIDAAKWLVEDIMPRVWEFDRSIECFLVGSDIPEELIRMSGDGIIPLGYIKDLNSVFNKVRLTIAPLRFGAGIKGKVLDSLGAGIPCVCTGIAAEGIPLTERLKQYIADSPEKLAELVYRLHDNLEENAVCSEAGLELCRTEFSEAKIDSLMKIALAAN